MKISLLLFISTLFFFGFEIEAETGRKRLREARKLERKQLAAAKEFKELCESKFGYVPTYAEQEGNHICLCGRTSKEFDPNANFCLTRRSHIIPDTLLSHIESGPPKPVEVYVDRISEEQCTDVIGGRFSRVSTNGRSRKQCRCDGEQIVNSTAICKDGKYVIDEKGFLYRSQSRKHCEHWGGVYKLERPGGKFSEDWNEYGCFCKHTKKIMMYPSMHGNEHSILACGISLEQGLDPNFIGEEETKCIEAGGEYNSDYYSCKCKGKSFSSSEYFCKNSATGELGLNLVDEIREISPATAFPAGYVYEDSYESHEVRRVFLIDPPGEDPPVCQVYVFSSRKRVYTSKELYGLPSTCPYNERDKNCGKFEVCYTNHFANYSLFTGTSSHDKGVHPNTSIFNSYLKEGYINYPELDNGTEAAAGSTSD